MAENGAAAELPPQAQLMQMAMGFITTSLMRTAAELSLADHLASVPRTAEELAALTGANAKPLYRFLRTLSAHGLFSEDSEHRFSLTPLAEPLRSDVPGSIRTSVLAISSDMFLLPLGQLTHSVKTGELGFDKCFGAPVFDYLSARPDEGAMFSELMIGFHGTEPGR